MENNNNFNYEQFGDNSDNESNTEFSEGRENVRRAELRRLKRKEAIKRRNTFIALVVSIVVLIIALIVFLVVSLVSGNENKNESSIISSASENSSIISSVESSKIENSSNSDSSEVSPSEDISSDEVSSIESEAESSSNASVDESSSTDSSSVKPNEPTVKLDPEYTNLLLVNGSNPLPEDYDYTGNLAIIEDKYLCGYRNQMNADVMPYATAMVEAAWSDGVELYILSPYRSYDTQKVLYENEVKKWMNTGMKRKAAEDKAATVVARPGTSEHHTGMAIDFNSVEDSFEYTPMYEWLDKNAQNYGFILRYTKEKQPITGVIHEAWHWRFVGINEAKKIKASGLCLEEYIEQNQ